MPVALAPLDAVRALGRGDADQEAGLLGSMPRRRFLGEPAPSQHEKEDAA